MPKKGMVAEDGSENEDYSDDDDEGEDGYKPGECADIVDCQWNFSDILNQEEKLTLVPSCNIHHKGGYHKVNVGEIYNDRYLVLKKLGW